MRRIKITLLSVGVLWISSCAVKTTYVPAPENNTPNQLSRRELQDTAELFENCFGTDRLECNSSVIHMLIDSD